MSTAIASRRGSTVLSTKGQVVIPKELREARQWHAGMSLVVEECAQGLLLRPAKLDAFAPSSLDDVMGSAGYRGAALSDEAIARALDADARRQKP